MKEADHQQFMHLQSQVQNMVREILDPISLSVEKTAEIPESVVDHFRRLGLFGMPIPKEYGGLGLSTLQELTLLEELTRSNAAFRSRIGTSNGIGSMGILYDGTEAQKKAYLPRIASGEWTAAFALTEPNAGSDAGSITTSAVLDQDHWVVNGSKIFITNADTAQVFTTIVVTDPEKGTRGGVTALIIERGMEGFSIGPADIKMGFKGSFTHELVFKDCRVPKENVIGGMDCIGKGFKTAMRVLDKGRLTIGACALGAAEKMLKICIDHVSGKIESGRPAPQAVQFALADMATQIFAGRQMLYHTALLKDQGENVTQKASMVKVFCSEMAGQIADRAVDLLEEEGCLTQNQVEMFLRDVRLYRIYEGTSEIQRTIIARHLLQQ